MTRFFLNTARTNGKRKRRQHERGYLRTSGYDLRRDGGSLFHLLFILCRVGREYVENHPKKSQTRHSSPVWRFFLFQNHYHEAKFSKIFSVADAPSGKSEQVRSGRSHTRSIVSGTSRAAHWSRMGLPLRQTSWLHWTPPGGPPSLLTCVKLRRPTRQASRTLRAHRAWPLPMDRPSEGLPLSPTTHIIYLWRREDKKDSAVHALGNEFRLDKSDADHNA
jgi:hypothetical protein